MPQPEPEPDQLTRDRVTMLLDKVEKPNYSPESNTSRCL